LTLCGYILWRWTATKTIRRLHTGPSQSSCASTPRVVDILIIIIITVTNSLAVIAWRPVFLIRWSPSQPVSGWPSMPATDADLGHGRQDWRRSVGFVPDNVLDVDTPWLVDHILGVCTDLPLNSNMIKRRYQGRLFPLSLGASFPRNWRWSTSSVEEVRNGDGVSPSQPTQRSGGKVTVSPSRVGGEAQAKNEFGVF